MRVCIEKDTGNLIGSLSGGTTPEHLETLVRNAVEIGYAADDIDVFYESDSDYEIRIIAQMESEKTYKDRRRVAYPPIGDHLDALWKWFQAAGVGAGTEADAMSGLILQVKADYPKPA